MLVGTPHAGLLRNQPLWVRPQGGCQTHEGRVRSTRAAPAARSLPSLGRSTAHRERTAHARPGPDAGSDVASLVQEPAQSRKGGPRRRKALSQITSTAP